MTAAPTLKLVPDPIDAEIADLAADITANKRRDMLARRNGTADVLPPDGPRYNDIENAEAFLNVVGEDLLYCVERGCWYVWDKTHWAVDNEDLVFALAKEFARSMYDGAASKDAIANAIRVNNRAGFEAFLKMAQRQRTVSISKFDAESTDYMLNCRNGTVNLRTGEIRDHAREDMITRVIPADYDDRAECPGFDKFLADIQPDPEIRGFLQRSIGYSLLGSVPEHAFWILYGIGNNGKSVFTKLFINLFGPYAAGMQAESLMDANRRAAGAANDDIARLKAKRYVLVSESNEGERINAAQIKALSAGDIVTARHLFKGFFDFAFTGKLWIATNHKPTISDPSDGLWRRVKLVPFAQTIEADKVIKQDELHAMFRREFSGILNWAVQGCLEYIEHDSLRTPPVIQAEIDNYRREQDSILQFIEECCQTIEQARELRPDDYLIAADFRVSNSDLYEAYRKFCLANGEFPRKHRRLTQNMFERGFRQLNSGGRYWEGIRLTVTTE